MTVDTDPGTRVGAAGGAMLSVGSPNDAGRIAVFRYGTPAAPAGRTARDDRPVVLAVHGYPDNHTVWDGVAERLADTARVYACDVRGAGLSDPPDDRNGYALPRLVADLGAVIERVCADAAVERVHLVGHDWGSLQGWAAVAEPAVAARIATFTSISGPDPSRLAAGLRDLGSLQPVNQLIRSGYIPFLLVPGLAEASFHLGIGQRLARLAGRIGTGSSAYVDRRVPTRSDADYRNGLRLYRANRGALIRGTGPAPIDVPVQVLMPSGDPFITAWAQKLGTVDVADVRTITVNGGHWLPLQRPDAVAAAIREWTAHHANPATPAPPERRTGEIGGTVALVTGAGAGIGRAVAVELARRGAGTVVLADLAVDKLAGTAADVRRHGADAVEVAVDVGRRDDLENLARVIADRYGAVDILVNNAGIGMAGRLRDTGGADWDRILAVNLSSVIDGTSIFGRQMAERGRGGVILNVASAAAFLPNKAMVAYSTTKGAVLSFTESARADLADDGIQVSAVCPGFVNTDIAGSTIYAGATDEEQSRARARAERAYGLRNYTPARAATVIADAIGKDKPIVLVGAEARLGRLGSRFTPALIRLLARYDVRL